SPSLLDTHTPPSLLHTLSLHDALPISPPFSWGSRQRPSTSLRRRSCRRSLTSTQSTTRSPRRSWIDRSACSTSCSERTSPRTRRSEEHTSELQSRFDLVCRLLLEKKNK